MEFMTQEVKITIHGLQAQGNGEPVEVVTVGQMEMQDGVCRITYDEVVEEEENGLVQVVKNQLVVGSSQIEVIKKGRRRVIWYLYQTRLRLLIILPRSGNWR